MEDLIAIITSFCSRIYRLRRSKRKTENNRRVKIERTKMRLAERHIIKKGHQFWAENRRVILAVQKVILQKESYTSVSNFLNLDPLPEYGKQSMGKRQKSQTL